MSQKPLLLFPTPVLSSRTKIPSRGPKVHFPSREDQGKRLTSQFEAIEKIIGDQKAIIQHDTTGAVPEMVLVLETIGSIDDFFKAVRRIPEMEWMAELEETFESDEFFFAENIKGESKSEKDLSGRLFLVMTNYQSLQSLVTLWNKYKDGVPFVRGITKWRDLFSQLKAIRPWDISDRLEETGILEEWKTRVEQNDEVLPFEIELWYRKNPDDRNRVKAEMEGLLREENGEIVKEVVVNEINYHALLVKAPIACYSKLKNRNVNFIKSNDVMYVRPVGQVAVRGLEEEASTSTVEASSEEIFGLSPVVSLFDGLPIQNHVRLIGRIIVDDPDNFEDGYSASERNHGTAMASLIINGDLNDPNGRVLSRPIYLRPILKSRLAEFDHGESIPDDILPIDLIHRAVKRMIEGENGMLPTAPDVKIINLSVCDRNRDFYNQISPWARLIDWLSYKYKILFILSAGNNLEEIVLDVERDKLGLLNSDELQAKSICSLCSNSRNRKILSPAESINSLTVGASHEDYATHSGIHPMVKNIFNKPFFSPISRNGAGFRRSVKPDILMPGGRQLYVEKPLTSPSNAVLVVPSRSVAGQKVAIPGSSGRLDAVDEMCGTSNAAALTTRLAALLYEEMIVSIPTGSQILSSDFIASLLKALVAHGASWGESFGFLKQILNANYNDRQIKEIIPSFIGYGVVNVSKIFECTEQRVTLLGCGSLKDGEGHIYAFPLPNSLSGRKIEKRITCTLAWLSPINCFSQKYRGCQLWFERLDETLQVDRDEIDWQKAKRGTLQHEIFEGDRADAFVDGTNLNIKVNCKEDGGAFEEAVPYVLIVTLEVMSDINIYDEIKSRLQVSVRV